MKPNRSKKVLSRKPKAGRLPLGVETLEERTLLTAAATFPPLTVNLTVNPPAATHNPPTVKATVWETGAQPQVIAGAEYFIDHRGANGHGTAMTAQDGLFNSSREMVTGTLSASQFQGLSEGVHQLYVHGEDAAGHWGPFSSIAFLKQTTLPPAPSTPALSSASDTGASATDGITRINRPTFTGTAQAGSTVKLYSDGVQVGSGRANSAGAYSITTSTLADGEHHITATATDGAGNVSHPSGAREVTIDTHAPAAPTTPTLDVSTDSGAHGDNITSNTHPRLDGSAEGGSQVTVLDGTTVLGQTMANTHGAWSFHVTTALSNGQHNITARATDLAGNTGPASSGLSLFIDSQAPTATVSVPDTQANPTNQNIHFGVQFSEAVSGLGQNGIMVSGPAGAHVIGVSDSGDHKNFNVTVGGMTADGSVSILVKAGAVHDTAGNASVVSATGPSVTYDHTAPTATVALAEGQASVTNQAPTFTVTFDSPVTGFSASGVTVTGPAGTQVTSVTPVNDSNGTTYTVAVGGMTGNGTIAIGVKAGAAHDAAGNGNVASTTGPAVTYDTTSPTATVSLPNTQATLTNQGTLHFTVTFSKPVTNFTTSGVSVTGPEGATVSGVSPVAGAPSGTTYDVTVSGMTADGAVSIVAKAGAAQDAAGNASLVSAAGPTVTYDHTAPAVPTGLALAPASDTGTPGDNITSDATPTITGSADAGSTVTLWDGTTQVGTGTAGNNGAWSITPQTALSNGPHTLTATATDGAGNTSVASTGLMVTINAASLSVGANTGLELATGANLTLNGSTLSVGDGGQSMPTQITYTVHTLSQLGSLKWLSGAHAGSSLAVGDTFTQNDINNGALQFVAGQTPGGDTMTFNVSVPATGASLGEPLAMAVTVNGQGSGGLSDGLGGGGLSDF